MDLSKCSHEACHSQKFFTRCCNWWWHITVKHHSSLLNQFSPILECLISSPLQLLTASNRYQIINLSSLGKLPNYSRVRPCEMRTIPTIFAKFKTLNIRAWNIPNILYISKLLRHNCFKNFTKYLLRLEFWLKYLITSLECRALNYIVLYFRIKITTQNIVFIHTSTPCLQLFDISDVLLLWRCS